VTGHHAPAPALTLANALALMPDTPAVRAGGVWYNNYALAERTYGINATTTITNGAPDIQNYYRAILPLRPGAETGVAALASGQWRLAYGYDLFQLAGDIHTSSGGACPHGGGPNYALAVAIAAGALDTAAMTRALAASAYTHAATDRAGFFHRTSLFLTGSHGAVMNALLIGPRRIIAGARPCDVAHAGQLVDQGAATLGQDGAYVALATALGPVQAAYLAGNIRPPAFALPPFPPPPGGHAGPPLHPFGFYAVAYQETTPGDRYVELGLGYGRRADALADVETLRGRLQQESLSIYGAPWSRLTSIASLTVSGNVLLARLRLQPSTPPTLWQDIVAEHALSLLSR